MPPTNGYTWGGGQVRTRHMPCDTFSGNLDIQRATGGQGTEGRVHTHMESGTHLCSCTHTHMHSLRTLVQTLGTQVTCTHHPQMHMHTQALVHTQNHTRV